MKTLVVGAGAMGRWFAAALADGHTDTPDIAFADADDAAATAAAESTAHARTVPLDTDEQFDVVCIAVPIPATTDAIETHASRATHAMVDVTGIAVDPVAAMREHAPECERLSLHPLFAPENAPGNVAVVADEPGAVTDDIRAALTARGNDCFETSAEDHDDAMETVQAQTHAAVLAFGLAADDVPDEFQTPVSEQLFALVEQVSSGDPRVYADIQTAFEGADEVAAAASEIAGADAERFTELYRTIAEER